MLEKLYILLYLDIKSDGKIWLQVSNIELHPDMWIHSGYRMG